MELRNFIKEALKDILGGVADAQKEIDMSAGQIIPPTVSNQMTTNGGNSDTQVIEFEVTVSVDSKAGSEAKLNVVAALVGGHVLGFSSKNTGHVGKLAFKIPVKFPTKIG